MAQTYFKRHAPFTTISHDPEPRVRWFAGTYDGLNELPWDLPLLVTFQEELRVPRPNFLNNNQS